MQQFLLDGIIWVKECSFPFLRGAYVSIRICLSRNAPDIMYGQSREDLQRECFRTRTSMLKCCTCHAHRMLFFTTYGVGKGAVCKFAGSFGFGRRVGGWEWEHEVTLGYQILYPQNYDNYMWLFGAFDAGFFMSKLPYLQKVCLITVICM